MRVLYSFALGMILMATLAICGLHFRSPISIPTRPEPFDPDLIDLQIRQAPKNADILLLGDSRTERWRFRQDIWDRDFAGIATANIGVGGSKTANVLWLVNSGKLSVFHPRLIVLNVGVNDLSGASPRFLERRAASQDTVEQGVKMIERGLAKQFPLAGIIILPDPPKEELAPDGIHLSDAGYETWARLLHQKIASREFFIVAP